jgi:mannose-1-phosphate guanylyltransferase
MSHFLGQTYNPKESNSTKKMNKNNYVAIMAGGVGSRFWPASRESKPKQFLDILGVGKSLIQLTYERFLPLIPKENILVVTNEIYRDQVKEHLPDIDDNLILCEPSRNNTAPSVAYTAFKLHGLNPKANFIMAPSDHIILDEPEFLKNIKLALDFSAKNDALLTLGIQPSRPDIGYGYINFEKGRVEAQPNKVIQFCEKPNLETAQEFLISGDYLWNAGIFIWTTQNLLNAFRTHAKDIYEILEKGKPFYNTPQEQEFISQNYPTTRSVSIDYAIMEKANNVYTIPSEFGWSDLGTWGSLHVEAPKDENNNVINTTEIILDNVSDCIIRTSGNKLIVLKDLKDYIIIDEGDVLMICPKNKEQEIKATTEQIKKENRLKFL